MSGACARVVAQAKINLLLRVLAREESGHHQIETVFQRIALGDDVLVRTGAKGRSLDCEGADAGPVEKNLAWRAALAFAERAGWPTGFAVEVRKRLPVGGGLGGGSADAAAVLRALNALAPTPLDRDGLLTLAAMLGADVPYLVTEAPIALAWGRGERMLALPALPERDVELLVPPFGVETGAAFAWFDAERSGACAPAPTLLEPRDLASWASVVMRSRNDLEPAVRARHPALDILLRHAAAERERGVLLAMTGSGSTCFRIVAGPALAAAAEGARYVRSAVAPAAVPVPVGWRVERTRTVSSVVPVEPIE